MKIIAAVLFALGVLPSSARGQIPDKPIVYNHVEGEATPLDQAVKKAFSAKFTVLDTAISNGYGAAKPTSGKLPDSPTSENDEPLTGSVLVAYIISKDGLPTEAVVLKTTDRRLNSIATDSMKTWRFTPAKLNGASVASTAAQEFNFNPTSVPKGFESDNIALYQTNEVLRRRLPGAEQLADYTAKLQGVAAEFFAVTTVPETVHIVVAVRPGRRAEVWFVSSTRKGDAKEFEPLRKKLKAVAAVEVRDGPIAFAISARIAGGDGKGAENGKDLQPPIPKEWQDAAKRLKPPVAVPDGILDAVWPDKK